MTSSVLNVLEHKSLKNRLNSARTLHTKSSNDRKAIGSKHSIKK